MQAQSLLRLFYLLAGQDKGAAGAVMQQQGALDGADTHKTVD